MKKFISLFFCFLLQFFVFSYKTSECSENGYLNELLEKAVEKELYKDRYWEILLHYKTGIFGTKSLIDDPRFFLSPDGKKNPMSELDATIRAFFENDTGGQEHPRCRFIARYTWLKERLMIDETKLPQTACKDFEEAMSVIKPKSAVLVFPTSFMNSPASMFGHTLLRIDSTYESKLLSYAVNYSAYTEESGGLPYALKGIFGFFRGYFSILPYYEKVTEYNDIDQRDLWEYNLDLTEDEVYKMVMHIWELKDIFSYYYFFDENCSYNLLFLLEAARPSIHITDKFGWWVIPLDTIRVVIETGMVTDVVFRPSKATKIKHIASMLDEDSQHQALKIMEGELLPDEINKQGRALEEKQKILDLAAEMIQYRFSKKDIPKEEYLKKFMSVLSARKDLGQSEKEFNDIPVPPQPEKGHRSNRFSIGAGVKGDKVFNEIKFRPAYHDLLDPDEGYQRGAQIIFGDFTFRYYHEDKKLRLESLDAINIVSLAPRDMFFKPISWKIGTGFYHQLLPDGDEHLLYSLNLGVGLAEENKTSLYYGMIEGDFQLSDKFDHDYALGVGASAGIIKEISDFWKASLTAKAIFYQLGDKHEWYKITLAQNFRLSADSSIRLGISRQRVFHAYKTDMSINWNIYF